MIYTLHIHVYMYTQNIFATQNYMYMYICICTYTHICTCIYKDVYFPYMCVYKYKHTIFCPSGLFSWDPIMLSYLTAIHLFSLLYQNPFATTCNNLFTDSTVGECIAFDGAIFCGLFHIQDIFHFHLFHFHKHEVIAFWALLNCCRIATVILHPPWFSLSWAPFHSRHTYSITYCTLLGAVMYKKTEAKEQDDTQEWI